MNIRVLGSAAGGGFPQWNCNCSNCSRLRAGEIKATARTQSSIAISAGGDDWILFNASPDIRQQLQAFPAMQPGRTVRDTAIRGIVLMDGHVDHTAGPVILREGEPLNIYCTDAVFQDLTTGNPILNLLEQFCGVNRERIPIESGEHFTVGGIQHLRFTAIPLDGKPPPFSPYRNNPRVGDNIGIHVEDETTGRSLLYARGSGGLDELTASYIDRSDCVLVNGTFWTDDELVKAGVSEKRAHDMGHLPQSGEHGMIQSLKPMKKPRKILIHINNTNPILDEEAPQRRELAAAGIEVAYDGMEIIL